MIAVRYQLRDSRSLLPQVAGASTLDQQYVSSQHTGSWLIVAGARKVTVPAGSAERNAHCLGAIGSVRRA